MNRQKVEHLVKTLTEIDRLAKDAELFINVDIPDPLFWDFANASSIRIESDRRKGPFFIWGNCRAEPTQVLYEYRPMRFFDDR